MSVTLHQSPALAEPAGTRPWMSGSCLAPGPHFARGAAANDGDAALTIGAASGVSPAPSPRARRSFCGGPNGLCAEAGAAVDPSARSAARSVATRMTHRSMARRAQVRRGRRVGARMRTLRVAGAVLAAACCFAAGTAQAEVGPDYVTSDNVEYIRSIKLDVGQTTGARIVGKRLYVTGAKNMSIYDISTP